MCRGRVLSGADDEPERILGTVLDVTEARDQAEARLVAVERTAAIAAVAAEVAAATGIGQLADITLRGAEVLGAVSGGVAVVRRGARRRPPVPRPPAARRLPRRGGGAAHRTACSIDLDDELPTQYTARTGERVVLHHRRGGQSPASRPWRG